MAAREKKSLNTDTPARVYTIAPGRPFLDTLAAAILGGDLPAPGGGAPGPLDLPRWTVLLPTRRAARGLREAFLRAAGTESMLLPAIRPLGDVDEDAESLAPAEAGVGEAAALTLPPAVPGLERRLALATLVEAWSKTLREAAEADPGLGFPAATRAQSVQLAGALAQLMDMLEREQADLGKLAGLVPERYAEHWRHTTEFLKIVTEQWPDYLAKRGFVPAMERRNALMQAQAKRLAAAPPGAPVIAAGSTGSIPATAALLGVVARLPLGAVVLPGFDTELDEDSVREITGAPGHPEHPQAGMLHLLSEIRVKREEVRSLGGAAADDAVARTGLLREAMRPPGTTARWRAWAEAAGADGARAAARGLVRIDARSEQDEAEVVALILRRAAQTPGQTAALVTPDRTLARRVSARLEKWGLHIDDSAGVPLAKTPPGVFMELVADVAADRLAPVTLLALLKHPLARLGRAPAGIRSAARALELTALRQPVLAGDAESLRRAMARTRTRLDSGSLRHPAYGRLSKRDWEGADSLVGDLERALAPLAGLMADGDEHTVRDFAAAHIVAAEALACDEAGSCAALWRGEAGETLAAFLAGAAGEDGAGLKIGGADYGDVYRALTAGLTVRRRSPAHPRLAIWGPLEARLQRPDIVVLGGLNEGVWPAAPDPSPWLNQHMARAIGLPPPERRTGLAAHDVSQLMGAEETYLTRAEKTGGAPSVPSRWLLRLEAVLAAAGAQDALRPADDWRGWAQARDAAEDIPAVRPPMPAPPAEARPKRLSVTRVEQWIANPYAIYAGEILDLKRLDDLACEPTPAQRGEIVHEVLHRFAAKHPMALPGDIVRALMNIAGDLLPELSGHPRVAAFWKPQLERFARWFAATEPARREGVARVHSEVRGELAVGNDFTLSARADRIDARDDGSLLIYDYKTGELPSRKQVETGIAPQLPLEAAMAAAGGFRGVPGGPVAELRYIRATGRGSGGEEREGAKADPAALASLALAELAGLVKAYAGAKQPYAALRRAAFKQAYRYDDYAHLARVGEWLTSEGGEEA